VLADRGREVLILREAQILTPRPGQNVAEQINPPPTVQHEVQVVLGVVHLGLLAGTGLKTLHQRPSRLRTQPPQMIPDNRILARKAAACQFLEHPHGGDVRIAGQQFLHRLLVIVQQTVPLDARPRQRQGRLWTLAGFLVLGQDPGHPRPPHRQILGNAPLRLARMKTSHNLLT